MPGYIKGFTEQYPDVNLRASAYDSGDAAIAKLRAGFEADVINLCVEEDAEMAVKLGLVQPLDISRIENWDRIFPGFLKLPGRHHARRQALHGPRRRRSHRPALRHHGGLARPDLVQGPVRPEVQGQGRDDRLPVTAIQIGALALGYTDPLHLTDEQLENVKNLYIEAKKNGQFRTFYQTDSDQVTLFKGHEVVAHAGWARHRARHPARG